jgi:hypothetical protein
MSSDVLPSVPVHPAEDLLEEYSFGRIREPGLTSLEEHLLICAQCQAQLLEIDEYRAVLKSGIAAFEQDRRSALAASPRFAFPQLPGRMLLAAAALLMFAGAIAWRLYGPARDVSEPMTVRLIALRGGGGDGSAHASAGRRLELVIDGMDLPSAPSYRLEIVSSSGRQVWSGIARVAGQDISGDVNTHFRSGVYWVRLYSGERMRREFALHID